jgi:hypothetical protein
MYILVGAFALAIGCIYMVLESRESKKNNSMQAASGTQYMPQNTAQYMQQDMTQSAAQYTTQDVPQQDIQYGYQQTEQTVQSVMQEYVSENDTDN